MPNFFWWNILSWCLFHWIILNIFINFSFILHKVCFKCNRATFNDRYFVLKIKFSLAAIPSKFFFSVRWKNIWTTPFFNTYQHFSLYTGCPSFECTYLGRWLGRSKRTKNCMSTSGLNPFPEELEAFKVFFGLFRKIIFLASPLRFRSKLS